MLADCSAQVVDSCCYLDALFDGRCCLKFVAADVDEPLVELLPLLGFCPCFGFMVHCKELKLLCSLSSGEALSELSPDFKPVLAALELSHMVVHFAVGLCCMYQDVSKMLRGSVDVSHDVVFSGDEDRHVVL